MPTAAPRLHRLLPRLELLALPSFAIPWPRALPAPLSLLTSLRSLLAPPPLSPSLRRRPAKNPPKLSLASPPPSGGRAGERQFPPSPPASFHPRPPARPGASMNHDLQLTARPERHALSRVRPPEHRGRLALHQLRGEVAEAGGSGTGCGDVGATSRIDGRERRTQPVRTPDQRKPAPAPRPNRAGTRPAAADPGLAGNRRELPWHPNLGLGIDRLRFHRIHLRDVGSAIAPVRTGARLSPGRGPEIRGC